MPLSVGCDWSTSGREDHGFRFDLVAAFRRLDLDSCNLLVREDEFGRAGLGAEVNLALKRLRFQNLDEAGTDRGSVTGSHEARPLFAPHGSDPKTEFRAERFKPRERRSGGHGHRAHEGRVINLVPVSDRVRGKKRRGVPRDPGCCLIGSRGGVQPEFRERGVPTRVSRFFKQNHFRAAHSRADRSGEAGRACAHHDHIRGFSGKGGGGEKRKREGGRENSLFHEPIPQDEVKVL